MFFKTLFETLPSNFLKLPCSEFVFSKNTYQLMFILIQFFPCFIYAQYKMGCNKNVFSVL